VFELFECDSAGGALAVTYVVGFCSSMQYSTGACFVVGDFPTVGSAGSGLFFIEAKVSVIIESKV